jgi:hypothetical protein
LNGGKNSRDRLLDDRRDRDRNKPLNDRRDSRDVSPDDRRDRNKPLNDRRDSRDVSPDDRRDRKPLDDRRDSRDRSLDDRRDRRPLDDRRDSRDISPDDRRDRDRNRPLDDRRDSRDKSLDGRRDSRDFGKDRDYDDPRDRDYDTGRDRDYDVGRDRDPVNGRDRDRLRDRDIDRDRRRDSRIPPRVPREPRDHPPSASKRNSITGRLLGSLRAARGGGDKDKEKEIPIPSVAASVQRRASAAVSKGSPVTRIREWLDACNAEHHHHCAVSSETDIKTWRPTWLVDVVDRRLVKATPKDRYLALSYVNGSHRNEPLEYMQLLKSNLAAFEDRLPNLDMPQTYLDAMWLAKKLGIRHIWIDRICITQDNREEMDDHIKHMAYTFANAYLVIVAASGDIHTGLPSLDPKRSTRGIRTTGLSV